MRSLTDHNAHSFVVNDSEESSVLILVAGTFGDARREFSLIRVPLLPVPLHHGERMPTFAPEVSSRVMASETSSLGVGAP